MSAPVFEHLLYQVEAGVLTLTLNRPDSYNSINDKISYELQDAFKAAAKDESVRVVVLTGAGKAFCSGQDLKEAQANPNRSYQESLHKRYNPIIKAMRALPKPIIGRINGVAAGAGCSLALACDIVVATEEAQFIEIFINIGLVPDSGSSWFLPRLIGLARAFEMCTTAQRVSARQAADWGLINQAVPAAELDAAVAQYAQTYANAPTKAIGLIKKMLAKATTSTLDEALEYEAFCQEIAGRSEDAKEGVLAFVEKRKPAYKGK